MSEELVPATSEAYEHAQEVRADEIQTNKEMDLELRSVWDRMNGPEAQEKAFLAKPPMPETLVRPGMSETEVGKVIFDWNNSSLEDRQSIAKAHRGLDDIKQAADSLGLKIETAADLKAAREIINGENGINAKPNIDPDMQSSLETFKTVVPFAKDHKEASTFLNGWVAAIQRDPVTGWRSLLEAQGVNVADLLTPEERGQFGAPQSAGNPVLSVVEAWAQQRGLTEGDLGAMADIVEGPDWKHIPGENSLKTLERAQKVLARGRSRQAQHKSSGDRLDSTLRSIANRVYGGAA